MSEHVKSKKRMLVGFWIRLVCLVLILGFLILYGSYVLTSKEDYGICPMSNLYSQPENTVDVLVIGTSLAYSGCNTNILWKAYGIASYNLCGADQAYWESYYLLEEALTMQHPKLIVLDAKAAASSKDYSTRARTIQHTYGIRNPIRRTEAIFNCLDDAKLAMEVALAYPQVHNRYSEITKEDFIWPVTNQGRGTYWKGYIENDLTETHLVPDVKNASKKNMSARTEEYLRKIIELAQSEDIPVLIVAFPNPDYDTEARYMDALWEVAKEYNVSYVDYNHQIDNIGLDYSCDFADGQHLNVRGSIKLSYYLGNNIRSAYHIPDRRGDPAYESYDVCTEAWLGQLYDFLTSPLKGEYNL